MKTLVGVGVGPGDPELVTMKAVRVLRAADVVVVPVLGGVPGSGRAESIVRQYVADERIKRLEFALDDTGGVTPRRTAAWRDAAAAVVAEFANGAATVAFGTLGDPNLYSTFSYLAQTVRGVAPDVRIETVAGITAMQDLASRAGISLAEGTEPVTLVPLNASADVLDRALAHGGTVIGYKLGAKASPAASVLRDRLAADGRLDRAVIGARLGLPGEQITPAADFLAPPAAPPAPAAGSPVRAVDSQVRTGSAVPAGSPASTASPAPPATRNISDISGYEAGEWADDVEEKSLAEEKGPDSGALPSTELKVSTDPSAEPTVSTKSRAAEGQQGAARPPDGSMGRQGSVGSVGAVGKAGLKTDIPYLSTLIVPALRHPGTGSSLDGRMNVAATRSHAGVCDIDPVAAEERPCGGRPGTADEKRPREVGERPRKPHGRVTFVGAGPGAAELLTLRGAQVIADADVVIWASSLVHPDVLKHAQHVAEIVDSAVLPMEGVLPYYQRAARDGLRIARIHSGDPSLWGAIQEQLGQCERLGLDTEIVPGVSSFTAVAARIGRELTIPEIAQSVILTRLGGGKTPMPPRERVADFARHGTTMALFLSAARSGQLQDELLAGGYQPGTPCVVAFQVTWPDELILHCELADLAATIREHKLWKHTLVLIGPGLAAADGSRSHLYHPGHFHGYRKADRNARKELRATRKTAT